MRRKDKEIKDKKIIETILRESHVCRIALAQDNLPYIIPMNFVYENNCVYMHSALEGKKIEMINKNNQVCFEVDIGGELVINDIACKSTYKYQSVIGFGEIFIIKNTKEKELALKLLMKKYSGKSSWSFLEGALERILILKIVFNELSGKKTK